MSGQLSWLTRGSRGCRSFIRFASQGDEHPTASLESHLVLSNVEKTAQEASNCSPSDPPSGSLIPVHSRDDGSHRNIYRISGNPDFRATSQSPSDRAYIVDNTVFMAGYQNLHVPVDVIH